jgi:hypothetical protein
LTLLNKKGETPGRTLEMAARVTAFGEIIPPGGRPRRALSLQDLDDMSQSVKEAFDRASEKLGPGDAITVMAAQTLKIIEERKQVMQPGRPGLAREGRRPD